MMIDEFSKTITLKFQRRGALGFKNSSISNPESSMFF